MTDEPAIIRARRVEIVGADGRPRVVIGDVGSPASADTFGLAVLDADGHERAWLALHATGPARVFDHRGNDVVHLGVDDDGPDALRVGPVFHMSDLNGSRVLSWSIESDGSAALSGRNDGSSVDR